MLTLKLMNLPDLSISFQIHFEEQHNLYENQSHQGQAVNEQGTCKGRIVIW